MKEKVGSRNKRERQTHTERCTENHREGQRCREIGRDGERARQSRRRRKVDRDRGTEAEGCTEEGSPLRLSLGIRQLEGGNRLNGVASPDSLGSSVAMVTVTRTPSSPTSVGFLPP